MVFVDTIRGDVTVQFDPLREAREIDVQMHESPAARNRARVRLLALPVEHAVQVAGILTEFHMHMYGFDDLQTRDCQEFLQGR
jgi:hypothetical protein